MKDLKLNLLPYKVIENDDDLKVWQLREDWLVMHPELEVRAELIEQLEFALEIAQKIFVHIEVESDKKYAEKIQDAITSVEEWRKK